MRTLFLNYLLHAFWPTALVLIGYVTKMNPEIEIIQESISVIADQIIIDSIWGFCSTNGFTCLLMVDLSAFLLFGAHKMLRQLSM